jgi:hypothetical protein
MATYYYANVRRYQDEESSIDATYLVKNSKITTANHKTNTKYYVYYLIDVYSTTISNFTTWVATGATDGSFDGKLVSPNAGTNENNGLPNGLVTSCTVNKNTTDTNVVVGVPAPSEAVPEERLTRPPAPPVPLA